MVAWRSGLRPKTTSVSSDRSTTRLPVLLTRSPDRRSGADLSLFRPGFIRHGDPGVSQGREELPRRRRTRHGERGPLSRPCVLGRWRREIEPDSCPASGGSSGRPAVLARRTGRPPWPTPRRDPVGLRRTDPAMRPAREAADRGSSLGQPLDPWNGNCSQFARGVPATSGSTTYVKGASHVLATLVRLTHPPGPEHLGTEVADRGPAARVWSRSTSAACSRPTWSFNGTRPSWPPSGTTSRRSAS